MQEIFQHPEEIWMLQFYSYLSAGENNVFNKGTKNEIRAKVRKAIIATPTQWQRVTSGKRFKALCELSGDSLMRMPPGCDINHPFADDLKRKDFITVTNFSESQILAPDFLKAVTRACEAAAPFMEFLTRALALPWSSNDKPVSKDLISVDSFELS